LRIADASAEIKTEEPLNMTPRLPYTNTLDFEHILKY
jgi:hypothetical protein